jgi:hypothetical protein
LESMLALVVPGQRIQLLLPETLSLMLEGSFL